MNQKLMTTVDQFMNVIMTLSCNHQMKKKNLVYQMKEEGGFGFSNLDQATLQNSESPVATKGSTNQDEDSPVAPTRKFTTSKKASSVKSLVKSRRKVTTI